MNNYDSIKNQEIKRKFVEREVLCNVSMMVEYILSQEDYKNAPFTWDEVENMYIPVCQECGNNEITEIENDDGEISYKCEYCNTITENEPETEGQEVFEWYLVTGWFADKLAEKKQVVIREGNICGALWGRTCTGQAILLDGIISEVCAEMGILEGQKYDWSDKKC